MDKRSEPNEEMASNSDYAVTELKFWVSQQKIVPELSDDEIQTFLHSCYYSVKDTKDAITSFYAMRLKTPQIFQNRNPELLQTINDLTYFLRLPGLTEEGYEVMLSGLFHADASEFVFNDLFKKCIMCLESWAFKDKQKHEGLIVVADAENFTFSHLRKVEFHATKTAFQYFQDAMPVRLKKIIIINISTPVYILLNMMQSVIAKRLVHLIEKHNKNSTEYFNTVPKTMFPFEYEGDCGSVKDLQSEMIKDLNDNKEWFLKQDEIISSIQAKQPRRSSIFNLFF